MLLQIRSLHNMKIMNIYTLFIILSVKHDCQVQTLYFCNFEYFQKNILKIASLFTCSHKNVSIKVYKPLLKSLYRGRAGLLTPFLYYHFLTLRYSSRRNPYTRNMFCELRLLLEGIATKPGTPSFLRTILLSVVAFASRLAPPQQAQQQCIITRQKTTK